MEKREYEIMYQAEESHWWFLGMAAITRSIIAKYYREHGNMNILDAGCGTGSGIDLLSNYGRVTGFDISPYAVNLSRRRGHRRLAIASVMSIPFKDRSFDLVLANDVLYFKNIQDDLALKEFSRILVHGGRIVIRVPAYNWLRGIHDTRVSTAHRYTLRELRSKMKKSGLSPVFGTYVNSILLPLVILKRYLERLLPSQRDSDITLNSGIFSHFFLWCLSLESIFLKKHPLPFGLSVIAVGRKC